MKALPLLALLALTASPSMATSVVDGPRSWTFAVRLDGSPIGFHRFDLSPSGDGHEVVSEASFDVRFLFFTAFRYRHVNREYWDGHCLRRIEAETRENDREFAVQGRQVDGLFVVESDGESQALDSCVMTFAYWDPQFLQQARLLSPQSGDYLPVNVESLGKQEIVVRGEAVLAFAFRLTARGTDLVVWYSDDYEWLGLETIARGGRKIRYELT